MSTRGNIVVRRLGADDWQLYRDLRLLALTDSPWAFASTLAREQQFTEHVWRKRLSGNCTVVASRPSRAGGDAEADGHLTLALWVVTGNDLAERVYARNGFVRTGRVQPVREGDPTLEYEMIRLLGSA